MSTDIRQLTERELETLRLVAEGLSNQQIANRLGISINTVKVHLRTVFGKIGVASRTEASMYAVRSGIITVERAAHQAPVEPAIVIAPVPSPLEPEVEPTSLEPVVDRIPAEPVISEVAPPASEIAQSDPMLIREEALVKQEPRRNEVEPNRRRVPVWAIWLLGTVTLLSVIPLGLWATGRLERESPPTPSVVAGDGASRWTILPDAPTPRAAFAVVNLANLVYLIGGENESGVLGSVQRYDPRSKAWADLTQKPTPVTDVHAAVVGGRLYVPGGRRSSSPGDISRAFERYDPRNETWEQLPELPQPRSGYALASLEGKIYLFGGWDGTSFRSEVFEWSPERETWRELTPMPTSRAFAHAVVVEGSIYVLGGENKDGLRASNEVYTPAQEGGQPWSVRAPLPQARSKFGGVVVLSSLIHIIGGLPATADPFQYNVGTDSWEPFAPSAQAIGSQPGVVLIEGTILSLGGKVEPDGYQDSVQAYQSLYSIFSPLR